MKEWNELSANQETDEEKLIVELCKVIHDSDKISTTSPQAVYQVISGRLGLSVKSTPEVVIATPGIMTVENEPSLWPPSGLQELIESDIVGEVTASNLDDAGFKTLEDLENATDEELDRVERVGSGTIEKIRKYLKSLNG